MSNHALIATECMTTSPAGIEDRSPGRKSGKRVRRMALHWPARLHAIVIAALLVTSTALGDNPIRARARTDLTFDIDSYIKRRLNDLFTYYTDLHANPELSLHEKESSRKIAERLLSMGYDVSANVGGYGVVGVMDNGPGPTVFIRGDMDALPIVEETGLPYASKVKVVRQDGAHVGVMHACGHDIHQTCLIGTAGLLAKLRDKWSGKVMIVAQPAEEIGTGAKAMIDDGIFQRFGKPDYCLALHVSANHSAGTISYTPGWALANVDSVDITIYGRGGHGSKPHEAIDPIMAAAQTVVALQTIVSRRVDPLESAVITVGSIHAGSKHNIIPDTAKLQITVRSYTAKTRRILLDGIRDITKATCRAMGCRRDPDVVIREEEYTPATYNDPALTKAAVNVLKEALGANRVQQQAPVMGGEDFGRFPHDAQVPGFIFWLGSVEGSRLGLSQRPGGDPLPSIHSSKYAPDPKPTIRTGVKAMTSIALSLLDERR